MRAGRGEADSRRAPCESRGAPLMASGAEPVLAVEAIHTAYGLSRVLFGVSFRVAAGECVCLLGRNGVGKTTTMRAIMGPTPPASGRIGGKERKLPGAAPLLWAGL